HQRWATGLLVDRANVAGGINLMNRGIFGSGHGWTIGWSVAWNSIANTFIVQRPPGSQNWSIGGRGNIRDQPRPCGTTNEPRGALDSHGTPVAPSSLYLAQLCERLGPSALTNIGYDNSNCVGFALSATPGSQTVTAGGSTSYTAAVTPSQGFNST